MRSALRLDSQRCLFAGGEQGRQSQARGARSAEGVLGGSFGCSGQDLLKGKSDAKCLHSPGRGGPALGLFLPGVAAASVLGSANLSNCGGGGLSFSALTFTWAPPGTLPGTGCFDTGIGTAITYSGGSVSSGALGNVMNLTLAAGPPPTVPSFMTLSGTPIDFDLTGFVAPTPTDPLHPTDCGNPMCVPLAGYSTAVRRRWAARAGAPRG